MGQKKRALWAAGALLLLALAFFLIVFVLRPPCLILALTGFYCPGCGGQRMVWAVLRGDFPEALSQNALLLFLLPLFGTGAVWEASRYARGKSSLTKKRWFVPALLAVLLLTAVFTLLRNLPGFEFLGPSA